MARLDLIEQFREGRCCIVCGEPMTAEQIKNYSITEKVFCNRIVSKTKH